MGLILQILAAILVAVGLAIVVVKYLPLKLRWIASLLLLSLTVLLVSKIYEWYYGAYPFQQRESCTIYESCRKIKNYKRGASSPLPSNG